MNKYLQLKKQMILVKECGNTLKQMTTISCNSQ